MATPDASVNTRDAPTPVPLRVLVVGAGIGGLAAAAALRDAGHHVTVLERSSGPGTGGACLGLQSNAVLALRELGVDPVEQLNGVPVERFELRSWRGSRLAWWSPGEVGRELQAPNITVVRAELLARLSSLVAGCDLRYGAVVESVEQTDDRVTAHLTDGDRVGADLLVGADGLRSRVRRSLGIAGGPSYAGYTAWRGISPTRPSGLERGTAQHYLGQGTTVGCWPLPEDRTYWVATLRVDQDSAPDRPPARLGERAPRAVRELLATTDPRGVLRTPVHELVGIGKPYKDRAVLIGDAAHGMQPTTGQGAGQALLDALSLASHLRGIGARQVPEAIARHIGERQHSALRVAAEASGLGRMHHVNNPAIRLVRDTVIRATPHRVWQQRAMVRLDERPLLTGVRTRRGV
ncbi:NAD(P)-binding protein [Nocardiopsis alba]|uniref:NAD(P)-binding protein n=1 Tax=Nocardiopsis alba TaxID=53437 RepID=A0A7K2IPF8_9ACTN|nr:MULTISPECIES: FAD-dependent monooxygenase [Nocardiopsis]MEC3894049.1 FAD-dependent monooxygenase [Nocardiopsis sp. LDBS1602]MYR31664.1 NAD(P)-binding protein [Nocardiopsis alba]